MSLDPYTIVKDREVLNEIEKLHALVVKYSKIVEELPSSAKSVHKRVELPLLSIDKLQQKQFVATFSLTIKEYHKALMVDEDVNELAKLHPEVLPYIDADKYKVTVGLA